MFQNALGYSSRCKIYNTMSGRERFENYFSAFVETLYPRYYNAGIVAVKSEVVGLDPGNGKFEKKE
jgi:hypothetical protein